MSGLSWTLLLTVVPVSSAYAIQVCYDYALYRAAQLQGIAGCDPTPGGIAPNKYLSAGALQTRLTKLGYRNVSGNDAATFGKQMFGTPGFAEQYLKPGDVVFLRSDHVGFVTPDKRVAHFIQLPGTSRTNMAFDATAVLPPPTKATVGTVELQGGLFQSDDVRTFLNDRTHAKGGGVLVMRPQAPAAPDARQAACPTPNTGNMDSATLKVPNDKPERVRTPFGTAKNGIYTIKASGVVSDWSDHNDGVDPVWCYAEWRCGKDGLPWNQLLINGKGMTELHGKTIPYNRAHEYTIETPGIGQPFEFWAYDAVGSSADNKGSWTVVVTRKR
jgi:hypothetical protein